MDESRREERSGAPAERRSAPSFGRMAWPKAALLIIFMSLLAWLVVLVLVNLLLR